MYYLVAYKCYISNSWNREELVKIDTKTFNYNGEHDLLTFKDIEELKQSIYNSEINNYNQYINNEKTLEITILSVTKIGD